MSQVQNTGTLPNVGPFSRIGLSYIPPRERKQPKRKTERHYPKQMVLGKCVRLVPCEVADRF